MFSFEIIGQDLPSRGRCPAPRTWLAGVGLQDTQICNGVRHPETITPADTQRRDQVHSSPDTSGIRNFADPAHTSTIARSSVSDIVSSSTGGFWCRPAASCGKYRRIVVGRLKTVAGSSIFSSSWILAVASRSPWAARLAPKRLPLASGAAAGLGAEKLRVW